MESLWPSQLDFETPIGQQEKPCTGMYLVVQGAELLAARNSETGVFVPDPLQSIDFYHWGESGSDAVLVELEAILRRVKTLNEFSFDLRHIWWKPGRNPRLYALIVGPVDGPLETDSTEWPEWNAIKEALPEPDPQATGQYLWGAWITSRIN
jgi:hypothetical protein